MEPAVSFIAVMEKRRMSVRSQLSADYDKQVQENTKTLMAVIGVIQFLAIQSLALRGHHWNKDTRREDRNFSAFMDFSAKHSAELNSHLLRSPRNVGFLSPKIQNEFACINGELIRKSIVQECNDALFWSVCVCVCMCVYSTPRGSCPVSQVGMVYVFVLMCMSG